MRGSKSPDGWATAHHGAPAPAATRSRPLPSRAACMLTRVARRAWRFVRYDFPEIALPSSLPDEPDVERKHKLMREMTLRQHVGVRRCRASLLRQPAASRRADCACPQILRATWTEYVASFRHFLPEKREREADEAAEGDAAVRGEGAELKEEAGANPCAAARRVLAPRSRAVSSRVRPQPPAHAPSPCSRDRGFAICSRRARARTGTACASLCSATAKPSATRCCRRVRWLRAHAAARVVTSPSDAVARTYRIAARRRRRACSRRRRTQERNQRGRDQAAKAQRKRRRQARRRGRQTRSRTRSRGARRRGHQGAVSVPNTRMCDVRR